MKYLSSVPSSFQASLGMPDHLGQADMTVYLSGHTHLSYRLISPGRLPTSVVSRLQMLQVHQLPIREQTINVMYHGILGIVLTCMLMSCSKVTKVSCYAYIKSYLDHSN